MKIVGINFHSKESRGILKSLVEGDFVFLKRDPENVYDRNAVKVLVPGAERLMNVGFVAKEQAAELSKIWENQLGYGRLTDKKNEFEFVKFIALAEVRALVSSRASTAWQGADNAAVSSSN